ncbi:MAG: alpha/beta hydrolase [Hyphomicrobiales bacterium]|nr:alpha/beta hydrolase [Hyphomicrobiales bacterium]
MPLDPDAARLLELTRGRARIEDFAPVEARVAYHRARLALQSSPADVAQARDISIPGPGGPLRLRLTRGLGAPEHAAPCLVFLHGGGWTIGDLDTHDYAARRLANAANCVVASVDYRLAPEHKFPAAVHDAVAALDWVAAHPQESGADPARLAIGGDSAGGNLAASAAILARDAGGPALIHQSLLYPSTDMEMQRAGFDDVSPDMPLAPKTARYFRDHYMKDAPETADWRASPLRAPSLAGLPHTFLLTVRHDPLRAEGADYARALEKAGVRVWHVDMNDQVHGFLTMNRLIRAADTALDMAALALRYAFAL